MHTARVTICSMDMRPDADMPDEALLVAYGNGDPDSARILVTRWTPRILAYAGRLLGGDRAEAEDVTQETMLRLWRIAREWRRDGTPVGAWLHRVAGNLCIDRLRRNRPVVPDPFIERADDGPAPFAGLQDAARLRALYAAMAELPGRQQQAVALRHIEGFSNTEIARILDTTPEAAESLTARGKRALSQRLFGRKAELGYRE